MKTLICSDIHDHVQNLERALQAATVAGCDSAICCGDLCSPFMVAVFGDHFNGPVHLIFGNNDGDRLMIGKRAHADPAAQFHLHGEFLIKQKGTPLEGLPTHIALAASHYPEPALAMAGNPGLEVVMYGHTHKISITKQQHCLVINPGSIMGYIPGQPGSFVKPTCVILNWDNLEADIIEL